MSHPTNSSLSDLQRNLDEFLSGAPFMALWRAVMDVTDFIDSDTSISDQERDWFDELYDLVYMGGEDPVDAESLGFGIIGADELRREIRELGLERPRPRPA